MTLGIVMHFYNEEFLLPFWIEHHKFLADQVILINHQSTDNSLSIISEQSPSHWQVVNSNIGNFGAIETDSEASYYESTLDCDIKIILNATEFLFVDKVTLEKWFDENGAGSVARIRTASMIDNHFMTNESPFPFDKLLWKNITYGYISDFDYIPIGGLFYDRQPRFLHSCKTLRYTPGRHSVHEPNILNIIDAFILWFGFAPWPHVLERKLQIQNKIPDSDIQRGFGIHHITNIEKENNLHQVRINNSYNLLENITYYNIYQKFLEIIK